MTSSCALKPITVEYRHVGNLPTDVFSYFVSGFKSNQISPILQTKTAFSLHFLHILKQKLHILQVEGSKIAKKINNNHPSFIYADMYQSLDKFELGFQAKTVHNIRGYVVVRRSEQEMRSMRYRMAQGTDGTDETAFF